MRHGIEERRFQLLASPQRFSVACVLKRILQLVIKTLDLFLSRFRFLRAAACVTGKLSGDEGRYQKHTERDQVFRSRDVERVVRRKKEEVETQYSSDSGGEPGTASIQR